MNKPKTALDYNTGQNQLPEGAFRISASQFNKFMDRPWDWYRENILGEEGFTGSTASVLGSCVHFIAECVGRGEHPDRKEIEQYIANYEDHPDVDCDDVRANYEQMATTLVNDYILKNMPSNVEDFVSYDLGNNFYPSGSCDAVYQRSCIVDYKTYNSKTEPKSIPMYYKYQLLIYAYIYTKMGYGIDRIRLVYVSKPIDGRYISEKTGKECGKIHPPKVTVLTESIEQSDLDFIESVLNLCKETVEASRKHPELTHLLFRDMRLKDK